MTRPVMDYDLHVNTVTATVLAMTPPTPEAGGRLDPAESEPSRLAMRVVENGGWRTPVPDEELDWRLHGEEG